MPSGGGNGGMQVYFTMARLELKGWEGWSDVRGSAIVTGEVGFA